MENLPLRLHIPNDTNGEKGVQSADKVYAGCIPFLFL